MLFKQLAIVSISLFFLSPAHAQGVEPGSSVELSAPYRIEKVVNDTVIVDFGENDPSPQRETLKEMTIVTSNGVVTATLSRFDQECVSLCGSRTDPTCHFVGIYAVEAMPSESGEPIVALLGRPAIEDLSMIVMEEVSDAPNAQDWMSSEYAQALNSHYGVNTGFETAPPGTGFRWMQDDQSEGKVFFESHTHGKDFHTPPLELASCGVQEYESFTRLQCPPDQRYAASAFLYKDRRLLITSFAEYADAAADLVAKFRFGGNTHYLVNIGLKAQEVIGILQPSGNGWKLLLRPKDYPTLC